MTERTHKQKLKALHKARKKLGLSKMGMKPPTFGYMLANYVDFRSLQHIENLETVFGIDKKQFWKLLKNKAQPTIEELVLIANHTNCSLQYWVGLATNPVVYGLYHK